MARSNVHLEDPAKLDFVDAQAFSELLSEQGIDNDGEKQNIAHCSIGEGPSPTRFALRELLGHMNVKNYEGSWTEYGSLVGASIEMGS